MGYPGTCSALSSWMGLRTEVFWWKEVRKGLKPGGMSCEDESQPVRRMRTMESWVEKVLKGEGDPSNVVSSKMLYRRESAMVSQSPTKAGRREKLWMTGKLGKKQQEINIHSVPNMCQTLCWLLLAYYLLQLHCRLKKCQMISSPKWWVQDSNTGPLPSKASALYTPMWVCICA